MSNEKDGRDTMSKRIAWLFLIGALAVSFQGIVARTASAHTLTVTATASCVNGAAVISYTAISWNPGGTGGSNTEIDILFNGVKVDAQPFSLATTPADQFSGQMPARKAGCCGCRDSHQRLRSRLRPDYALQQP